MGRNDVDSKHDAQHEKLMTGVAQSTSYNILLQLIFRVVTFVLNAIILRHVTKDLLGVVNVRLTLLYSTILFVGREAFRKACLSKTESPISWQEKINIAWCSPIVGIFASLCFCYIWLNHLDLPNPAEIHSYSIGVTAFSLAAILEMTIEPLFIIGQAQLYVRFKAIMEGLSLLVKVLVTIILVRVYPEWGLISFCIAQLSYTAVYVFGYVIYFGHIIINNLDSVYPVKTLSGVLPARTGQGVLINGQLASLTWSFLKQSFLKQLLTEGERYMMTMFSILSFADQGIFDIISNLGSLVARFFFLPLEESSYLLFSQSITRGAPATAQSKKTLEMVTGVLANLLKLVSLVSLIILVYGYSYSSLALFIYGGEMLSAGTGPSLLRWYCVYILTLAVNGITECFSFATMSQQAVDKYNYKMLGFSGLFLLASYTFTTHFGSAGFIMANCCNMGARIIHSIYIIELFYLNTDSKPLLQSLLAPPVYLLFVILFVLTSTSEMYFGHGNLTSSISHVVCGVAGLLVLAVTLYRYERHSIEFIYQQFIRPLIKRRTD